MRKILILCMIFGVVPTSACTRIGPGYVGLKVNMAGGDRGKSEVSPVYGWTMYFPPTTDVVKINTRNQHYEVSTPLVVQAKGGTNVIVHPSFNYHINGGFVDSLYITWGVTNDEQIQGKLLETALLTCMREVTNTWTVDSLLNYRGVYDQALARAMDFKLNPYASTSQFTSGVQPDESMAQAIAEKAGSIQKAITAENQEREQRALANLEVIKAQRDSATKVIRAKGEAMAISVKQQALSQSPQYVDLVKAERWDGKLPIYMPGNSSGTIFQMK